VSIQASVLRRLREVLVGDAIGVIQIGNGAGDLQNPVMRARRYSRTGSEKGVRSQTSEQAGLQ
jgi:hypothetical protein